MRPIKKYLSFIITSALFGFAFGELIILSLLFNIHSISSITYPNEIIIIHLILKYKWIFDILMMVVFINSAFSIQYFVEKLKKIKEKTIEKAP